MKHNRNQSRKITAAAALAAAGMLSAAQRQTQAQNAPINYSSTSTTYTQNFSALGTYETNSQYQNGWLGSDGDAKKGTVTNGAWDDTSNPTIPGWYASESTTGIPRGQGTGGPNELPLEAGDGTPKAATTWTTGGNTVTFGAPSMTTDKTTITGGLFSLGLTTSGSGTPTQTGSSTRALGSATTSTSSAVTFGVEFTNTTGHILSGVNVGYTGEEWFTGYDTTPGRGLTFEYGVNQSSIDPAVAGGYTINGALGFGTGTGHNALPVPGGTTAAVNGGTPVGYPTSPTNATPRGGTTLDGTNPLNQTQFSSTIPLVLDPGQTIDLIWTRQDTLAGGPLLGVSNFSFSGNQFNGKDLTFAPSLVPSYSWDTSTVNWTDNNNSNAPTAFTQNDIVEFTQAGVGTVNVASGGVSSTQISVSNTSGTYAFTGGAIGGGELLKTGAGTLVLGSASNGGNSNTFSALQINGGIVEAFSDGAMGDPNAGTIGINGGTLQFGAAFTTSANRSIQVSGTGGSIDTNGNNVNFAGVLALDAAFSKKGTGQLVLSNSVALGLPGSPSSTFSILAGSVSLASQATGVQAIVAPAALSSSAGFIGDLYLDGPYRFQVEGGTVGVASGTPGHVYVDVSGGSIYGDSTPGASTGTPTTTTFNNPIVLNHNNLAQPFTTGIGSSSVGNTTNIGTIGGTGEGISGNGNVVFTNHLSTGGGAGVVELNVANSWTGTTSFDMTGPVIMNVNGAIPDTAFIFGNGHGGGLGQLDLNGQNLTIAGLSTDSSVGLNATNAGDISNGTSTTSTITLNGSVSGTYQGVIGAGVYVNPITGNQGTDNIALVLAPAYTGTLTLTGANTFNAGSATATNVTISGGALDIETWSHTVTVNGSPVTTTGSALPANSNVLNNSTAAYGLVVNDSTGTTATKITGTGNTAIGSAGLVTVGTLTQGTVSNAGTLTITTGGTITTALNNSNGTSTQGSTTIASTANVSVGSVLQNSLTVNGKLSIIPGPVVNSVASESGVNSLLIAGTPTAPTGTLDLGNSKMVIDYAAGSGTSPDSTVRSQILSGRGTGAWTGTGITSSTAATSAAGNNGVSHYEVFWADGNGFESNGTTSLTQQVPGLTAGHELIEVTQAGDGNGDGIVDASDYVILANDFNKSTTLGPAGGDYNYSGAVDASDYVILANNFNQGTKFTPAQLASFNQLGQESGMSANWIASEDSKFTIVTPEPGSLGLMGIVAAAALTRRRRRPI